MSDERSKLEPGSRWREVATGRVIVIIDREVHGTGPSWSYEDGGNPGEINWHYSDAADFLIWKRFEPITDR